jgi:hypothetical protein
MIVKLIPTLTWHYAKPTGCESSSLLNPYLLGLSV